MDFAFSYKVLAPTSQTTNREEFCADDSHSGGGSTFEDAIAQVHANAMWQVNNCDKVIFLDKSNSVIIWVNTKIKICFTKVGEGPDWPGTSYESWGEMPQVENHQHISSQHSNIQTMLVCRGDLLRSVPFIRVWHFKFDFLQAWLPSTFD